MVQAQFLAGDGDPFRAHSRAVPDRPSDLIVQEAPSLDEIGTPGDNHLDTATELLALHGNQAPYRARRIIAAHMKEENHEAVLYWSLVLKVLDVSGYA